MDPGDDNDSSSIKLRKYAKKARMGRFRKLDGSIHDVPGWEEEPDRVDEIVAEIVRIEKCFGPDQRALTLR